MRVLWAIAAIALATGGCKKEKQKADPAAEKTATDTPETPPEEPAPDPAVVERGRYMADVTGCMFCHTPFGPNGPDMSKAWAGGLEITEKMGKWVSPNITPDEQTGIGTWTDEQIMAAIREGKRPNGSQIKPIMPYLFYNAMSDDDARALVAFLRTVPAVNNKVENTTDLKMPDIPAPKPAGKPPGEDPVARGAYYASLMHCVMCHTPPSKTGMPDMAKSFAGGFPMEVPMMGEGVLYSSNITPDKKTGIGAWTDEQITAAIREMKKKDGKPIVGPMMLYQVGWSKLAEEDVKGIVAFLRSLEPIANKVPRSTFKPKAGGPPPPAGDAPPAKDPAGGKAGGGKAGGGKAGGGTPAATDKAAPPVKADEPTE